MFSEIAAILLGLICFTNAYVILGPEFQSTRSPVVYLPPSEIQPSRAYLPPAPVVHFQSPPAVAIAPVQTIPAVSIGQLHSVPSAAVSPVQTVSTYTHEEPVPGKSEQSHETIIAGPSGVIRTSNKASEPAIAKHTSTITTNNAIHAQPITYLAPPVVHSEPQRLPADYYFKNFNQPLLSIHV